MENRKHLIMVPCHSIWKSDFNIMEGEMPNLGQSSKHWFLAPFQYEGNDHITFIKHGLRAIVEYIDNYAESIVLFSGSRTKKDAGPVSEAQSYFLLMWKIVKFIDQNDGLSKLPNAFDDEIVNLLEQISKFIKKTGLTVDEIFTSGAINNEEYALDSFENLCYSICRFNEITNSFPQKISIIGFGFKKERFIKYHAKAIDIPPRMIEYISIEPKPLNYTKDQLEAYFADVQEMENKNALKLFQMDWYGQKYPLFDKKQNRNPYYCFANYKDLQLLKLNDLTDDPKRHYEKYVRGKMPWSMEL